MSDGHAPVHYAALLQFLNVTATSCQPRTHLSLQQDSGRFALAPIEDPRKCRDQFSGHCLVQRTEYWRLKDAKGKPPGLMGWWPSRAVTFLENHDTVRLLLRSLLAVHLPTRRTVHQIHRPDGRGLLQKRGPPQARHERGRGSDRSFCREHGHNRLYMKLHASLSYSCQLSL